MWYRMRGLWLSIVQYIHIQHSLYTLVPYHSFLWLHNAWYVHVGSTVYTHCTCTHFLLIWNTSLITVYYCYHKLQSNLSASHARKRADRLLFTEYTPQHDNYLSGGKSIALYPLYLTYSYHDIHICSSITCGCMLISLHESLSIANTNVT